MGDASAVGMLRRDLSALQSLEVVITRCLTRHPLNLKGASRFDLIEGVPKPCSLSRLAILHGVPRSGVLRLPPIFQPVKNTCMETVGS
jgi:hypothetical protein